MTVWSSEWPDKALNKFRDMCIAFPGGGHLVPALPDLSILFVLRRSTLFVNYFIYWRALMFELFHLLRKDLLWLCSYQEHICLPIVFIIFLWYFFSWMGRKALLFVALTCAFYLSSSGYNREIDLFERWSLFHSLLVWRNFCNFIEQVVYSWKWDYVVGWIAFELFLLKADKSFFLFLSVLGLWRTTS